MAKREQFKPSRISLYSHWEICEAIRRANKAYTDSYVLNEVMTHHDQMMASMSSMTVDFVWTAMMFTLQEGYGWHKQYRSGIPHPAVETALSALRTDLDTMRKFRNVVFHVYTEPMGDDIKAVDKALLIKVEALNDAFRNMFSGEIAMARRMSEQADQTPGNLRIRRMISDVVRRVFKPRNDQMDDNSEMRIRMRKRLQDKVDQLDRESNQT